MNIENGYQIYVPTKVERITRFFGYRNAPYIPDWESDGLVASGVSIGITANISFVDRLRILLRGKVEITALAKTNVVVDHAETRSEIGVPW